MKIKKETFKEILKNIANTSTVDTEENEMSATNVSTEEDNEYGLFAKFPILKQTIEDLFTKEYKSFIEDIEWIVPRPTTFKVVLKNKRFFFLKWLGDFFEAEIAGKRYDLVLNSQFQQALKKIATLLKFNPIPGKEEEQERAQQALDAQNEPEADVSEPEDRASKPDTAAGNKEDELDLQRDAIPTA